MNLLHCCSSFFFNFRKSKQVCANCSISRKGTFWGILKCYGFFFYRAVPRVVSKCFLEVDLEHHKSLPYFGKFTGGGENSPITAGMVRWHDLEEIENVSKNVTFLRMKCFTHILQPTFCDCENLHSRSRFWMSIFYASRHKSLADVK